MWAIIFSLYRQQTRGREKLGNCPQCHTCGSWWCHESNFSKSGSKGSSPRKPWLLIHFVQTSLIINGEDSHFLSHILFTFLIKDSLATLTMVLKQVILASPEHLLEMQNPRASPGLMNQNLHFNKTPRGSGNWFSQRSSGALKDSNPLSLLQNKRCGSGGNPWLLVMRHAALPGNLTFLHIGRFPSLDVIILSASFGHCNNERKELQKAFSRMPVVMRPGWCSEKLIISGLEHDNLTLWSSSLELQELGSRRNLTNEYIQSLRHVLGPHKLSKATDVHMKSLECFLVDRDMKILAPVWW